MRVRIDPQRFLKQRNRRRAVALKHVERRQIARRGVAIGKSPLFVQHHLNGTIGLSNAK